MFPAYLAPLYIPTYLVSLYITVCLVSLYIPTCLAPLYTLACSAPLYISICLALLYFPTCLAFLYIPTYLVSMCLRSLLHNINYYVFLLSFKKTPLKKFEIHNINIIFCFKVKFKNKTNVISYSRRKARIFYKDEYQNLLINKF